MYRVLLVEYEEYCSSIVDYLLKEFCQLDITNRGERAIDLANANKYDLILMDIKLNYGINGVEATKRIREIEGYDSTPIVAFTAYALKGDKEYFLSQGLTHYISKPFNLRNFVATVKEILYSNPPTIDLPV